MATRESSVLFSLNELRGIEQQRIRDEAEFERRRVEAERRAREDELRRAREAEEALRRAAEEAERQAARERERQASEERLRLREAELRALSVEETRLEAARIAAETQARLDLRGTFPVGRVIAGTLLSVGLVVVILFLIMQKRDSEVVQASRAMAARLDAEQRELQKQQEVEKARFEAQLADLRERLQHARDGAEAASIKKQIDEKRRSSRPRPPRSSPASPTVNPELKVQPGAYQDPLGTLKLD